MADVRPQAATARSPEGWRRIAAVLAAAAALFVGGCHQEPVPAEVVRPVRTIVVEPGSGLLEVLAGEIRPRHEARIGFRIGGQLVRRNVDVGTVVRAGQVLAELDPKDYRLALQSAVAQVTSARSQFELTDADLKRYRELRARNFISEAEFDRRESLVRSARATLDAAEAERSRVANQAGYATLLAPNAGVVVAVEVEAGQVLEPGQAVLRLARLDEKEVAVSVPEQRVAGLSKSTSFTVRLASNPTREYHGRLREIAPSADPASRTYPARVALEDADDAVRLGMSAQVEFGRSGGTGPRVPLAAVFHRAGSPAVWIVDPATSTVRLQAVTVGPLAGNQVEILSGIETGQRVVTAGVQLLEPGRKVRLLEGDR